jgi:hypothetical protein
MFDNFDASIRSSFCLSLKYGGTVRIVSFDGARS